MKITSCLCEGNYDFEIDHKEYRPNDESTFEILIGSTTLTLTKEEWLRISDMVLRSMNFLDQNHFLEA
jgi:hypothetical protein